MSDDPLVRIANVASLMEADLAVSVLAAEGIHAIALGNDTVGIFGPGFSVPSARGVDVLVRAEDEAAARAVLAHRAP